VRPPVQLPPSINADFRRACSSNRRGTYKAVGEVVPTVMLAQVPTRNLPERVNTGTDVLGGDPLARAALIVCTEVAVGLAILVSVFKNLGTIDVGNLKNLKG
jgi:hypothetical protein